MGAIKIEIPEDFCLKAAHSFGLALCSELPDADHLTDLLEGFGHMLGRAVAAAIAPMLRPMPQAITAADIGARTAQPPSTLADLSTEERNARLADISLAQSAASAKAAPAAKPAAKPASVAPPPVPPRVMPSRPAPDAPDADRAEIIRHHPHGGCGTTRDVKVSPERFLVFQQLYPSGAPVAEILQRLNALPGRPFKHRQVAVCAAHLGFRRPSRRVSLDTPPESARDPEPEHIDWPAAQQWAANNGVRLLPGLKKAEAMQMINAKRTDLGLPPWMIVPARHSNFGNLPSPKLGANYGA